MRLLWFSLGRWSSSSGSLLIADRVYLRSSWTPLVILRRRYPWRRVWRGVWPFAE